MAAEAEAAAAAAEAEAAAAELEELVASKVQAMEAGGYPAWKVQLTAFEERHKICTSLLNKLNDLQKKIKDLPADMSEAERGARKAKVLEERRSLTRVLSLVAAKKRTPDYSSGMTEAERAAEAERMRQQKLEEARRLKAEGDPNWRARERLARITDFDPKQSGMYLNRISFLLAVEEFDIDEESPFGPMRFKDQVYASDDDGPDLCAAINILSVNIACSDVGFPIQVYGSVIARDSTDYKCVYLFRRDRDHCQFISSEDESLILTGPKRGLTLLDHDYVEIDLMIKDHEGRDRELSKGIVQINGTVSRYLDECKVERVSLATRLSTVDVLYAVVIEAVEGTVAVTVLKGEFCGTITAHTTSIGNRIVLYDSIIAEETHGGQGVIQLMRSAVSVYTWDMLIVEAKTSAGESERLSFTPRYNGEEGDVISLGGATKIRVVVSWSAMDED